MWSRRWYNLPTCDLDFVIAAIGFGISSKASQRIWFHNGGTWRAPEAGRGRVADRNEWIPQRLTDASCFGLGRISQIPEFWDQWSWISAKNHLHLSSNSDGFREFQTISDPSIGSNVSSSSFAVLELQMWWRFWKKTWWCSGMKGGELQTWPA
jgi:hypothetical protein